MFRPMNTLTVCLRPIVRAQRKRILKPFNLESIKARVAHWEPTLSLDGLRPNSPQANNDEDGGDDMYCMVTYRAFDPRFSRPLALTSGMGVQMPTLIVPLLHKNEPFKPWPYYLPAFLRPKADTTLSLMNGTTDCNSVQRFGILQAILYSVLNPETFSYAHEVVPPGSLLDKVLHGIKEMEDGEEVISIAKLTAAKSDETENTVMVRNVEVEVEETLEHEGHCGFGIVAK
ncbi:hypothetical protein EJ02DRAFT_451921 [Clathrospora elynae]|uniref:Uncharacterized protein n=1 Tax=Clathrospora elynae TaxID=706981 RepID=A0A6A5SWN4_9PLEO|nr:hypothetical protein EJ02DRAFT_451921 [Clathrospora elynae]